MARLARIVVLVWITVTVHFFAMSAWPPRPRLPRLCSPKPSRIRSCPSAWVTGVHRSSNPSHSSP